MRKSTVSGRLHGILLYGVRSIDMAARLQGLATTYTAQ